MKQISSSIGLWQSIPWPEYVLSGNTQAHLAFWSVAKFYDIYYIFSPQSVTKKSIETWE